MKLSLRSLMVVLLSLPAGAQVSSERIHAAQSEPQNWLTYNGSYASTHHSALKEIGGENVRRLELKWVWQANSLEKLEATPLVVDGVMYLTDPPNDVVAIDARTGRVFWRYHHPLPPGVGPPQQAALREVLKQGADALGPGRCVARMDHPVAKRASLGEEIVTTSPVLCVKPRPGSSRSWVGANSVPRNSTNPSGYWCSLSAWRTSSSGSRLICDIELRPVSSKPSGPCTRSVSSAARTSLSVKLSSNRRNSGPTEQEALLSLALPSSSADRPSKSRRFTSLPSVAPTASPRLLTTSTISGSGLFQLESERTPMSASCPTQARRAPW